MGCVDVGLVSSQISEDSDYSCFRICVQLRLQGCSSASNDEPEDEKLLSTSCSSVYAKRHLPLKKLSIRHRFLFDDDTVGLHVENKGCT